MLFAKDKYKQVVVDAYCHLRAKMKMVNNMYLISNFIIKHHIRIRTRFLTIGCTSSARFVSEISHSRRYYLGGPSEHSEKMRIAQ